MLPAALVLALGLVLAAPPAGPPVAGASDRPATQAGTPANRGAELRAALLALSAPSASERAGGERWIAAHISAGDFPTLAEAAASGGAEVCLRLARAIGSDDAHLALAMLFATDRAESLVPIGEDAVREIASRWGEGLGQPLIVDRPTDGALREALKRARESWPAERYLLRLDGSPEELAERIARLASLPIPLCVDPNVAIEARPTPVVEAPIEGSWDQLVARLAAVTGLSLEGALFEDASGQSQPVFLCLRPQRGPKLHPASSLLLQWCRLTLEAEPGATRAARTLGALGWPAALDWFEKRWTERGDPVALEGLLVGAGRGWIVPTLLRESSVRALLRGADDSLRQGGAAKRRFAELIMRALQQSPPVGLDGGRVDELLIEGWGDASEDARLMRLIVLETMGSASERVHAVVAGVLADAAGHSVRLRLQALRAWCSFVVSQPLELDDPLGLIVDVVGGAMDAREETRDDARDDARELAGLLLQSRVVPPEVWPDPMALDELEAEELSVLLEWQFGRGAGADAARHLLALCRFGEGWPRRLREFRAWRGQALAGEVLHRWVRRGEGDRVGRWLESLRSGLATPEERLVLHRVAVLAGAPTPEGTSRDLGLLQRLLPAGGDGRADGEEEVLGVLAGRPLAVVAGPARAALFVRLAEVFEGRTSEAAVLGALSGVERCLAELFSMGDDVQAAAVANEARGVVRESIAAGRARELVPWDWPVGPGSRVELDRIDRSLRPAQ